MTARLASIPRNGLANVQRSLNCCVSQLATDANSFFSSIVVPLSNSSDDLYFSDAFPGITDLLTGQIAKYLAMLFVILLIVAVYEVTNSYTLLVNLYEDIIRAYLRENNNQGIYPHLVAIFAVAFTPVVVTICIITILAGLLTAFGVGIDK